MGKRLRIWILALSIPAIAGVIWAFKNLPNGYQRQIAELRAEGIPLSADELNRMLKLSDAQNAAPTYNEVFRLVQSNPDIENASTVAADLRKMPLPVRRKEFSELQRVWSQLEKGAKYSHYYFANPWTWKGATEDNFRQMYAVRLAKTLVSRAEAESADGKPLRALATLKLIERMYKHLLSDPALCFYVSNIETLALRGVEEICSRHHDDAKLLTAARDWLKRLPAPPNPNPVIFGQLLVWRNLVLSSEFTKEPDSDVLYTRPEGRYIPHFQERCDEKLLAAFHDLYHQVDFGKMSPAQIQSIANDVDHRFDGLVTIFDYPANQISVAFTGYSSWVVRSRRERNLAKTYVEILLSRKRTGKWPSALPASESSLDPETGKGFGYRTSAMGFKLAQVPKSSFPFILKYPYPEARPLIQYVPTYGSGLGGWTPQVLAPTRQTDAFGDSVAPAPP